MVSADERHENTGDNTGEQSFQSGLALPGGTFVADGGSGPHCFGLRLSGLRQTIQACIIFSVYRETTDGQR